MMLGIEGMEGRGEVGEAGGEGGASVLAVGLLAPAVFAVGGGRAVYVVEMRLWVNSSVGRD